jgi:pentatricopeptide repeat protein
MRQAKMGSLKAQKAFEEAKAARLANAVTYSSFIDAAGKNGKFEEAQKAFKEAKNKRLADAVSDQIYIDILVHTNRMEEARQVFDAAHFALKSKTENGISMLDLHGFSHGAGLLFLLQYIVKHPKTQRFGLIPGIGCREDGNYLTFRAELGMYIDVHIKGWKQSVDEKNEGVLFMQRR